MKKVVTKGLSGLLFIAIFIQIALACANILAPKPNKKTWDDFYALPKNTLDVAFFGSSHAYCTFNPLVLWEQDGITSYCLGSDTQPLWFTYHYLVECFKYQSPSVVVLEGYTVQFDRTYYDEVNPRYLSHSNTTGLRMSRNRWELVRASLPEDMQLDYFLGFPTYHSRYQELERGDFSSTGVDSGSSFRINGYRAINRTVDIDEPDLSNLTNTVEPFDSEVLYYLDLIVELVQRNDAKLVFVVTPSATIGEYQAYMNHLKEFGDQNNIAYIDYNQLYEAISFDFAADLYDEHHTNISGSSKVCSHLSAYLSEEYSIPDRRGDSDYQVWQDMYSDFARNLEMYIANG